MKAQINDGLLAITPENQTEDYALSKWFEDHKNGCSYIMKPLDLRNDISFNSYKELKRPTFPPDRITADGAFFTSGICPICHSTVFRKHILFGLRYCINPDCSNHINPIVK
jgi:hypothetical protein